MPTTTHAPAAAHCHIVSSYCLLYCGHPAVQLGFALYYVCLAHGSRARARALYIYTRSLHIGFLSSVQAMLSVLEISDNLLTADVKCLCPWPHRVRSQQSEFPVCRPSVIRACLAPARNMQHGSAVARVGTWAVTYVSTIEYRVQFNALGGRLGNANAPMAYATGIDWLNRTRPQRPLTVSRWN